MAEQHTGLVVEKPAESELNYRVEHTVAPEVTEAEHEASRLAALENSRNQIEKVAEKAEVIAPPELAKEPDHQLRVNNELKEITYQRTLTRARKHLAKPDRLLSRLTHQPMIDALSNASEKSIARPSGILGGAVVALMGSSMLLYMSKHYGFRYNFLAFSLLFILGFAVGLLAELLLFFFKKSQR